MKRRNIRKMKIKMFKVLAVALLLVSTILSFSALSNGDKKSYDEYEEIYVRPGDTLWTIAEEFYGDSVDIREAVYAIKECSGIDSGALSVGQKLLLPALD